jgi:Kinase associated domain 1
VKDLDTSYGGQSIEGGGSLSSTGMKVCRGPFNVNCTTARDLQSVLAEMLRALDINRVSYKKIGTYGLRCQKNNVRFDMEIAHLDNLDNIYVVKFKRLAGEMQHYKEVSGKVLSNMNLSTNTN